MSKHWINTQYKNVYEYRSDVNKPIFKARIVRQDPAYFKTAKEAAMQVDVWLINRNKKPINILKKQK